MSEKAASWASIIAILADGEELPHDLALWAMNEILQDRATKDEIKSFLLGVQAKGESPAEVQAFLEVMFTHSAPISISGRADATTFSPTLRIAVRPNLISLSSGV